MKKEKELKFIDLFAGIGGIRLGFQDKNTKCVYSSEWDRFAKKTYFANFNQLPDGDITKVNAKNIPDFDVLLAGFPCQPFSSIGKREGFANKTQGTLFFDVLRILRAHRPKAFILENVPGLLTIQHGKTFDIIIKALKESHYSVFYKILNAKDFGVPQNRRRVIITGFRNDLHVKNFELQTTNHKKPVYIKDILEHDQTDYSISKHMQDHYLFKKDDGHPLIVDYHSKTIAKTLNATYHKVQRLTGTFVKDGPTGIRLLSENECKALQGFPKNFKVPVSRTQMYRQFGNSVAVPMIKSVSEPLKAILRNGGENNA